MAVLGGEPPPADTPALQTEPDGSTAVETTGQPGETGGPKGPEPTRFGDWERKGRCIDF